MSLSSQDFYRFDDFELQPSRRLMLRKGERVALAPKTFEVLFCLVTHAGHVVLKEDLLKAVWPESFVEESNLTQHIFWLRKALADKSGYIETIVGRGYEFTGEVTVVPHPEPRLQQTASFTSLTEVLSHRRRRDNHGHHAAGGPCNPALAHQGLRCSLCIGLRSTRRLGRLAVGAPHRSRRPPQACSRRLQ